VCALHEVVFTSEQEQRADLRQLRAALWCVDSVANGAQWLAACRERLDSVGDLWEHCLVYAVDNSRGTLAVQCCELTGVGAWRGVGAQEQRAVVRIWESGETMYRGAWNNTPEAAWPVLEEGELSGEVLYMPIVQGVVVCTAAQPSIFSAQIVEFLEEVAEAVSGYLYRIEDLRRMEAQIWRMRCSQRLEMIDRMAASTAHEINNVLTALLGKCELILLDRDQPPTHENIETVHQWTKRVQNIAGNLLGFVRKQRAVEKERFDLNILVRETLELMGKIAEDDHIYIAADLEEGVPQVEGHIGQIQQVLVNLLKNSREAIGEHKKYGKVRIETRSQEGQLILAVEDDGPGVPVELAEHIFKPFFTTKTEDKGIGLGLSICRDIVQDHGGRLWVDLAAGGGRMVLELPIRAEV